MFFDTVMKETLLISILYFFISAVSKVHLKLAWHLDGNRAYVWLFMFLFLFCFSFSPLLILIFHHHLLLVYSCLFFFPSAFLPHYPFILCSFSLRIICLLPLFSFILSVLASPTPPHLLFLPLYLSYSVSLSDHSKCGSGASAEPLPSASL